jgi:TatA/E family protein of Tat protein translocase
LGTRSAEDSRAEPRKGSTGKDFRGGFAAAPICVWPGLPPPHYHRGMNLGFSEMAFLFMLALLIFGPKKLPEIGRQIGRFMNDFKRASNEFRSQIETEINNLENEVKPQILPPLHEPLGSLANRIFNPPSPERLQAAEAAAPPDPPPAPEPPPSSKVAPDV